MISPVPKGAADMQAQRCIETGDEPDKTGHELALLMIPTQLEAIRKIGGFSLKEMAQRLGCSYQSYLFWKDGIAFPHLRSIRRLHTELGVDLNSLIDPDGSIANDQAAAAAFDDALGIIEMIKRSRTAKSLTLSPETIKLIAVAIAAAPPSWRDIYRNGLDRVHRLGWTGFHMIGMFEDSQRELADLIHRGPATIGDRIRSVRLTTGLSCNIFAQQLNVPQTSYLVWENGPTEPKLKHVAMLCSQLRLNANWVIAGTEGNNQSFRPTIDWDACLQQAGVL